MPMGLGKPGVGFVASLSPVCWSRRFVPASAQLAERQAAGLVDRVLAEGRAVALERDIDVERVDLDRIKARPRAHRRLCETSLGRKVALNGSMKRTNGFGSATVPGIV